MKSSLVYAIVISAGTCCAILAEQNADSIQKLESTGDVAGARAALARQAEANPNHIAAWVEYAEFLDRYGDPAAREAYAKLLEAARAAGDSARASAVMRRLALLELLAGDRNAAMRNLEAYRAAGGKSANPGTAPAPAAENAGTAEIPGPLRSFARMAAISPDAEPVDILPALARNVVTNGYQASNNNEALEQTEYLKLVHRYLSQARELDKLAGESRVLKIDNCESPASGELLRILGFRMRGGCGSEVVLETVNAPRAFLTTDSGFPVNELEEALRTNRVFTYDFHPFHVPVLFGPVYWSNPKDKEGG